MPKKAWIKLIVIAAAAVLFVVLVWQNAAESARFNFLFFEPIQIPQILLMVILFGLGFVAGIFTAFKVSSGQGKVK